jgi:hypothetical protein
MLKRFAVLAGVAVILVAAVVFVTCKYQTPCRSDGNKGKDKAFSSAVVVGTPTQNQQSGDKSDKSSDCMPCGHKLLAWPEGITVWAVLLTMLVIGWQSWETSISARAANDQISHMIASERARVQVEIEDEGGQQLHHPPRGSEMLWIRPTIKNVGRTIATITGIRAVIRLNKEDEQLPHIPEYPLGQGVDIKNINVVLPPNVPFQPIKLGVTRQEYDQVKDRKLFLYVHGWVEYADLSPNPRSTAFCFYYAVRFDGSPDPTNFYLELTAPPKYNKCT